MKNQVRTKGSGIKTLRNHSLLSKANLEKRKISPWDNPEPRPKTPINDGRPWWSPTQ